MLKELGISFSTAVFLLIALYFVIKWAVRNALDESKAEIAKAVEKGLKRYEQRKAEGPMDGGGAEVPALEDAAFPDSGEAPVDEP